MNRIPRAFFEQPRLSALALAVIVVSGLAAYQVLPRSEDPTLAQRFATIITFFPGATAERVEALVTEKIEDELTEIEELRLMDSFSRSGVSVISLELDDAITDLESAWADVRTKLDQAEANLPAGAGKPEFELQTITAFTLIVALVWEHDGPVQYGILNRMAEQLEDELRSVAGTAEVELFGAPDEEVHVDVRPEALAGLGLSPADIADIIAAADAKAPAGRLDDPSSELLVEVRGEVETLARVREIPVRTGAEGRMVRVGDIADVRKTVADPPNELALASGRPAVVVAVRGEDNVRIDHWAERARAVVRDFSDRTATGVSVETLFDQSGYVESRLNGLAQNLLISMGLVTLVILFLMGWRSAIAVGLALPLASLMVLSGMRIMGVPLHQMSVTGLIVALGLLIDNAIVIVDEVRRRAETSSAGEAVAGAVRHLALPLFGSTFTTALAFMPIVLMPGAAGEFVGSIGLSVILAIASSFLLAMTITPAITGWTNPSAQTEASLRFWSGGIGDDRITAGFRRGLHWLVQRPVLGVLVSLILPISGFLAAQSLEEQFFPPADRNQFQIELHLPTHASLAHTRDLTDQARAVALEIPGVEDVHWFVGLNAPKFYYNLFGTQDGAAFYAQALVQLEEGVDYYAIINRVQAALDRELPAAQFLARQLEQGPPFNAPVEVRLYGPDLYTLNDLADQLRAEMSSLENVTHTRTTLGVARPKLWLTVDEADARRMGLSNQMLTRTLQSSLSGGVGGSLLEETEELPVRVRLAQQERGDVSDLMSVNVITQPTAAGQRVYTPVAAISDVELRPELSEIPRRAAVRTNVVQAFLQAGELPSKTLSELKPFLDEWGATLPAGYQMEIGGESAERDRAIGNLMASVSVLFVMMIATLVLSFNSFRLAFLLAVAAALSLGLGMLALSIGGYPFGFMAIVGTMGLIGVSLNDSIVVLAALREKADSRDGNCHAVTDVVVKATRHVIATTATTCIGFTPLLLAGGGFWPPLAVVIGGGVIGSSLIALLFVPSAYRLLMCRTARQPEERSAPTPEHASETLTPAPA